MEGLLWLLPVVGCGLMMALMVVMMWGMGKDMFSSGKKAREEGSIGDLRAEQERLAAEIDRLETKQSSSRERTPHASGA
jgi:hypothetical protein